MIRFRDFMERHFTAVAFGEGGLPDEAIQIMGKEPKSERVPLRDIFAAVAFAEEGFPDMAMELLGRKRNVKQEEEDFASLIGLKGIRIWYGVAQV